MVTAMQQQSICWGGTMALRRETIDQIDLLKKWRTSFNDDVLAGESIRRAGLELKFVPSLVMIHRDPCRLSSLLDFVRRQLIHVRLTHSRWTALVVLGICSAGTLPAAVLLLAASACCSAGTAASITLATLALFLCSRVAQFRILEPRILRILMDRNEAVPSVGIRIWWGIPLAASMHLLAQFSAMLAREVRWRGITYKIRDNGRVLISAVPLQDVQLYRFPSSGSDEAVTSHSEAA